MFRVEYKRMYDSERNRQWIDWFDLGKFYSIDEAKKSIYLKLVDTKIHNPKFTVDFKLIGSEDNIEVYTLTNCSLFQFRFPKIETPWYVGLNDV